MQPTPYSSWDNPMDRGAWWATVHGIEKSWSRLSTHPLVNLRWPLSTLAACCTFSLSRIILSMKYDFRSLLLRTSSMRTFYAFSPLIQLLLSHFIFELVKTSILWCCYYLSTPSCFNFLPISWLPFHHYQPLSCSYSQFSFSIFLHSRMSFTSWWNSTSDKYFYLVKLFNKNSLFSYTWDVALYKIKLRK